METVYAGQTLRLQVSLTEEDGSPSVIGPITAEGRISIDGVIQTFPAVVDETTSSFIITVDRETTALWRPNTYQMRVWLNYGEGQPIEALMVYELQFKVPA